MMKIFLMGHNYRIRYLVMINGHIFVYKYDNCKFDQPILSFQSKNIFIGKSRGYEMTEFSEALDKTDFDGNTDLLECGDNKYVYISGLENFDFKTSDKFLDYISLMGKNMVPYTFAVGEIFTYFISTLYKFIENDKIKDGMLFNSSNDSFDPYDYHLSKNGSDCFKILLECKRIQSFWLDIQTDDVEEIDEDEENNVEVVEEDNNIHELKYTVGSNKVVNLFNQKWVIWFERNSDYLFKQCGHQCICEKCYQKKGNIDILRCVVCRT